MKLFKILYFVLFIGSIIDPELSSAMEFNSEETKKPQPGNSAFIAIKDQDIIKAVGPYRVRHAPFSTFKVALALMGFDAGILETKDSPKWGFKTHYEKNFQSWYSRSKGIEYHWCEEHTPATFMKYSVVWFSHKITKKLGKEKFQDYIKKLNYGNMDISGTPAKEDGLINSWLGTSLEISPYEQVKLIERLCSNSLNLSEKAQEKTKEIMDREEEWNGWKLYGKTGGGHKKEGWFVGWIEKEGEQIIFAHYFDAEDPGLNLEGLPAQAGLRAKELARRYLKEFLKK